MYMYNTLAYAAAVISTLPSSLAYMYLYFKEERKKRGRRERKREEGEHVRVVGYLKVMPISRVKLQKAIFRRVHVGQKSASHFHGLLPSCVCQLSSPLVYSFQC
jgi:hypothetical protein